MKKVPLKKRNVRRAKEAFTEAFGEKGSWVRGFSCAIGVYGRNPGECDGLIEAAHVRSRGAGGAAKDIIPLCTRHHREQHDAGIRTTESKYAISFTMAAALYEALYQMEKAA